MSDREITLTSLINFSESLETLQGRLSHYNWDSESEIVKLSTATVLRVLERALTDARVLEGLEEWANLIEVRDDIGYDNYQQVLLKEIISRLANPVLFGAYGADTVKIWISKLEDKEQR